MMWLFRQLGKATAYDMLCNAMGIESNLGKAIIGIRTEMAEEMRKHIETMREAHRATLDGLYFQKRALHYYKCVTVLRKYTAHASNCDCLNTSGEVCSCGLEEALDALDEGQV